MKKGFTLLVVTIALLVPGLFAQNSCDWTEDAGKSDTENLLDLLQCLAEGESHCLLKKHFESVKMVMEKPDADYTEEYLTMVSDVYIFMQNEGQLLSTYVNNDVRPLIMAFTSPTDSVVSLYKLTLPEGWEEDHTDYPLYIELHGYSGGKNNNPLRHCLRMLQSVPQAGTEAQLRRDGYHLYPWGRGDKFYKGIAGKDVWECLGDFDEMYDTDPRRQYIYGYSMGGGGAWNLAHQNIDRWAAIGCYSPYLPDSTLTMDVSAKYAGVAVWVAWGSQETWAKENGSGIVELLSGFDAEVEWFEVEDVGHSYLGEYQEKMIDFFASHPKVYYRPRIYGSNKVVLPYPVLAETHTLKFSHICNQLGNTDGMVIDVQAENNNLLTDLQISEIYGDGTAELSFVPVPGIPGTVEILVTLSEENGNTVTKHVRVHAKDKP